MHWPATWRNILTGITGKIINVDLFSPAMSSEGRKVQKMKEEDEEKGGVRVKVQYQRKESERAKMKRMTRMSKSQERNPQKKHHLWLHQLWWMNQRQNQQKQKKKRTN